MQVSPLLNKGVQMYEKMDRRARKSREAIFRAFESLVGEKIYSSITVGEIIERAVLEEARSMPTSRRKTQFSKSSVGTSFVMCPRHKRKSSMTSRRRIRKSSSSIPCIISSPRQTA